MSVSTTGDTLLAWAGNWASIVGLAVSIAGFLIAYWQIRKVKSAAEAASSASNATRRGVQRYDAAVELSACIAELEEAKRLNRANATAALPERYAAARKRLIGIRAAKGDLPSDMVSSLQGAITQLAALERDVEGSLGHNATPIDGARHNSTITKQSDKLVALSARLRLGGTV